MNTITSDRSESEFSLGRLFSEASRRLFFDRHADFWLREIEPTLSLKESRATITRIVTETPSTKTFWFKPNQHWKSFRPGQYVPVEVEIEGVRTRRCYSISSTPKSKRVFAITVKRVDGGVVSGWLHDRACVGDVLGLGSAAGDFVLPASLPRELLFISGGSGVTPVHSILSDLSERNGNSDVVHLHYDRQPAEMIFASSLRTMAEELGMERIERITTGLDSAPHLDENELRKLVPDFTKRTAFVCGPPALIAAVERIWTEQGIADRLQCERFISARPVPLHEGSDVSVQVTMSRSGRSFEADGKQSLLEQAEKAGANPAHGCRMGICKSCTCRKKSGTVRNLLTGALSSDAEEDIQICVSAPVTDVEIHI